MLACLLPFPRVNNWYTVCLCTWPRWRLCEAALSVGGESCPFDASVADTLGEHSTRRPSTRPCKAVRQSLLYLVMAAHRSTSSGPSAFAHRQPKCFHSHDNSHQSYTPLMPLSLLPWQSQHEDTTLLPLQDSAQTALLVYEQKGAFAHKRHRYFRSQATKLLSLTGDA